MLVAVMVQKIILQRRRRGECLPNNMEEITQSFGLCSQWVGHKSCQFNPQCDVDPSCCKDAWQHAGQMEEGPVLFSCQQLIVDKMSNSS